MPVELCVVAIKCTYKRSLHVPSKSFCMLDTKIHMCETHLRFRMPDCISDFLQQRRHDMILPPDKHSHYYSQQCPYCLRA
jgi:hypothetical protein